MSSICFYFQVHQPFRISQYQFSQIGVDHNYEDESKNKAILERIAKNCYLPTNQLILDIIEQTKGAFKVAYSITGTALEQFEMYAPEVIQSFQRLIDTGCVEILGETYYHSLSFMYDLDEFIRQVEKHRYTIKQTFGVSPKIFRNTELIYKNDLAELVASLGFEGVLCEGVDKILRNRTPNVLYTSPLTDNLPSFLKNYKLSDDIAFRFSDHSWDQFPLTVDKYIAWLKEQVKGTDLINLFMDYETFGEHHSKESGIFEFFKLLPSHILSQGLYDFITPSEAIRKYKIQDFYNVSEVTSWADENRDLSAWVENNMQKDAIQYIYSLKAKVAKKKNLPLLDTWAKLQTSDHFYYMSTKYMDDGKVHQYFSPFDSPFDAYIYYMNIVSDFEKLLDERVKPKKKNDSLV